MYRESEKDADHISLPRAFRKSPETIRFTTRYYAQFSFHPLSTMRFSAVFHPTSSVLGFLLVVQGIWLIFLFATWTFVQMYCFLTKCPFWNSVLISTLFFASVTFNENILMTTFFQKTVFVITINWGIIGSYNAGFLIAKYFTIVRL
jgi:hypothetical protein